MSRAEGERAEPLMRMTARSPGAVGAVEGDWTAFRPPELLFALATLATVGGYPSCLLPFTSRSGAFEFHAVRS